MVDKIKVSILSEYRNKKKFMEDLEMGSIDIDTLPETEKSVLELIKDGNEVVSYKVEDKSICLHFFDGADDTRIEFYIDNQGNIQARILDTNL
jgi:hypothetical protein